MDSIGVQFLIGGSLVASITYLAKHVSPKAAALLVAFPIGLIPMLFLKKQDKEKQLSFDTTITNMIVVLTYVMLDLFLNQGGAIQQYGIELAILLWGVLSAIVYHFGKYIHLK